MTHFFRLRENQTTLRTEVVAGLTTYFTMAYIIFVNPSILEKAGMDYNSVLVATCLAAALGTLLMAFLANYPFAQAPGMGLNAFFTFGWYCKTASPGSKDSPSYLSRACCLFCSRSLVYAQQWWTRYPPPFATPFRRGSDCSSPSLDLTTPESYE